MFLGKYECKDLFSAERSMGISAFGVLVSFQLCDLAVRLGLICNGEHEAEHHALEGRVA
jgi:hypothetical protein